MSSPALLSVQDLAYAYNGVAAVRGVSFEVGPGEVVALLGANGAGKSTTVKVIAGALAPQAGSIRFDGAAIEGRPCHVVVRRGITLVPEGRLVFPQLSVLENLSMGAHTRSAADVSRNLIGQEGVEGLPYWIYIVHFPLVYFRMDYYVPLVLAPLVAFALIRVLRPLWAAIVGGALVVAVAALAWPQTTNVRDFYAFSNRASLRGLDAVAARLAPGEVVATDRCWSFQATWLLHTPTLPALEPEDIQPKAELARAAQARAVLRGSPAGRRLARRLGIRYLLVDPTCVDAKGHNARPPTVGVPQYVSKRLVVLRVSGSD